jgi:hypothetical protein
MSRGSAGPCRVLPMGPSLCYNGAVSMRNGYPMDRLFLARLAAVFQFALWLAMALDLAGCGCRSPGARYGSPDQLRETRLRFTSDEDGESCYIVAEVENAGELPVKAARVAAILRSSRGKELGINYYPLENVAPGEKRVFSMKVTAHGRFSHVELAFHGPDSG